MAKVTEGGLPQEVTNHPAYRGDMLNQVTDDKTFECDGCIRSVACTGTRYRLELKGKRLEEFHICCAVAPATQPSLKHPTFGDLKFKPEPPERNDGKPRVCGVCHKAVNRFVYHCSDESSGGRYYHPCCALQSCKCSTVPDKRPRQKPYSKWGNPYF